jgi:hypothetical protein
MISIMVKKMDSEICPRCVSCVMKRTIRCNNCEHNELLVFNCPFCNAENIEYGKRSTAFPLVCSSCNADVTRIEDMCGTKHRNLRMIYHVRSKKW